jgi:hypothetical protein
MPDKVLSRERYGEAFWRKHHEAWQQSALNQREYCEAHGIPLKGNCGRSTAADEAKKRLSPAPVLMQEKRQIERAAETESVPAHARGIRQGHVGEALEQHGEQDDANGSPRQVRARAMMRAVAKGLVRIGLAQPVVVLAIFEGVLVSVGRRLDRHHGVALRDESSLIQPANSVSQALIPDAETAKEQKVAVI